MFTKSLIGLRKLLIITHQALKNRRSQPHPEAKQSTLDMEAARYADVAPKFVIMKVAGIEVRLCFFVRKSTSNRSKRGRISLDFAAACYYYGQVTKKNILAIRTLDGTS